MGLGDLEDLIEGLSAERRGELLRELVPLAQAFARVLDDYGPLPQHQAFVAELRARHGRKTSFRREVGR